MEKLKFVSDKLEDKEVLFKENLNEFVQNTNKLFNENKEYVRTTLGSKLEMLKNKVTLFLNDFSLKLVNLENFKDDLIKEVGFDFVEMRGKIIQEHEDKKKEEEERKKKMEEIEKRCKEELKKKEKEKKEENEKEEDKEEIQSKEGEKATKEESTENKNKNKKEEPETKKTSKKKKTNKANQDKKV